MESNYYKEKLISLFNKIFTDSGDIKTRLKNCENNLMNVRISSFCEGVPEEVNREWNKIWDELHSKEPIRDDNDGEILVKSIDITLQGKRNKTLERYLHFILEEFYRIHK